ncbi:Mycophenolic acid acyl-glucuronide esterase, mitochondrial, partial [Eschrichtius robustus]|nr:Mycophenolic acid acyl-glucuronide esterase, mitochondrial [Eschrichtius robustus]
MWVVYSINVKKESKGTAGREKEQFDYSGVGNSDGNLEECTVGKWRKDVLSIIDDLAEGPQILVGSSLGGWLMLHAAIARPQKVVALIGVATAVDGLVTQFNQLPVESLQIILPNI